MLPVLLLTGCGLFGQNADSATERPVVAESAPSGALAGANLAVGATMTHQMLTHCGVESVKINGHWWNAVTPLYGPGGEGAGPPADWDEPWQEGNLTLETEGRAVFDAVGEHVVLTRSPVNEPVRICR